METEIMKTTENRMVTFIEKGIETLEGAMAVANFLLESKIIPYHFYEKLPDGKPDFSKGKAGAVAGVLVHGIGTLKLPAMTALQNIIPVNGLLSLKGDLAKSMIFSSGMLRKDSWKEVITGTIEDGDMEVTITATREDNGLTLSKSFSINDAKRAGLWITEQQVNGQDGWKFKPSPWWKYQKRMLYYRPLGYLARDLFGDVLNNMYITEEAMDLPKETAEVIETESGAKITIPDKEHSQKRAEKMTTRVADKIKTEIFAPVIDNISEAQVVDDTVNVPEPPEDKEASPFVAGKGSVEMFEGKVTKVDGAPVDQNPPKERDLALEDIEKMKTEALLEIINTDMDMMEVMQMIPGKNTNKKLREIIYAYQRGILVEHVAPYLNEETVEIQDNADIQPNTDFDKQKAEPPADNFLDAPAKKKEDAGTNKYSLDIPAFDKSDQRDFATMKALFNALVSITPRIDNPRFLELGAKLGILENYPDREIFTKFATISEINALLEIN